MLLSVPLATTEGKDWFTALKAQTMPEAQKSYIACMKDAQKINLTKDDFRDRIVLALDVARIPTSVLATATGIASNYLERYIIGSECVAMVRTIACESIAAMDPELIPQPLPEERALRAIDKMSQLEPSERNTLIRKYMETCAFDWSSDTVFSRLVTLAIDTEQYSAFTLSKEMGFTASFVQGWCSKSMLPLPITRRRFMQVLHVATYVPLPKG